MAAFINSRSELLLVEHSLNLLQIAELTDFTFSHIETGDLRRRSGDDGNNRCTYAVGVNMVRRLRQRLRHRSID